ncbi:MAG: glycerophosphodiester phosphodiesterase, partial [Flaviramulus sp.]
MNCTKHSKIDIQGHRGCGGLMPENTIPAFLKAIDLGVNTLELDVVVTKDNIVLVSHEPYMNPEICLDINGNEIPENKGKVYNIYKMTLDSVKLYDCGIKAHPRFLNQEKIKATKPTLDEVIKESKKLNANIKFNIEIKYEPSYKGVFAPEPTQFVSLVLKVLEKNNALESSNLQSFDLSILEEIKKQEPDIMVALLVDENESILEKILKLSYKPEIISPYFKLLDE